MPEIAEVARIVHYLKTHLVGKTIKDVEANEDRIVFKDTTHLDFISSMKGKKVVDAKQQGKYFWLVMDSSPHPLMHFGMTGWIVFKQAPEAHYRADREDDSQKEFDWPPRFVKFMLKTDDDGENDIAFVDPRRLGRVRLIDEPKGDIRKLSPLKENGPDPVVDGFEEEWFKQKVLKRKVPIKALLLDQAFISGVGNWVGDEILYHARIHPEQYSNTLSAEQTKQLYQSTMHICKTACYLLGQSSKFPKEWLMLHRWGKGKKGNYLPNGDKIDFVTVGGRTSAYVKTRQKATGGTAVKKEDKTEDEDRDIESQKSAKKRKAIGIEDDEAETPIKKGRGRIKKEETTAEEPSISPIKKSASRKKVEVKEEPFEMTVSGKGEPDTPSGRRSSRLKK